MQNDTDRTRTCAPFRTIAFEAIAVATATVSSIEGIVEFDSVEGKFREVLAPEIRTKNENLKEHVKHSCDDQ
jgi:hypothetical protein